MWSSDLGCAAARPVGVVDELVRSFVSRLWAEDCDSPEDAIYDDLPSGQRVPGLIDEAN